MTKSKEIEAKVKISGKVDSSLAKATKAAKSAMKGIGKVTKVAATATAAASAAVTAGAVVMTKKIADIGVAFNDAKNTIRAGTGATGEALNNLYDDMKEVYKTVPTTLDDASNAIADYNTRLGLTGEPLQKISEQAIQINKLLGEDISTTVTESSRAFQQWNISADDMSGKMDYIFKVSQSTGSGFNTLFSDLQQYGVQLQEMGYDFDTASTMIGQLNKAGVNVEQVLGGMRKAVANLAKDGISASDGLQMYVEQIKNAGSATEATAIASEVFGKQSAAVMVDAIRDGTFSAAELTAQLQASKETIDAASKDTYTFSDKLQILKQKAETALEPLGSKLLDVADKALPYIQQGFEQFMPVIQEIGENLVPEISLALEEIKPLLSEIFSRAGPGLKQTIAFVRPILKWSMNLAKQVFPLIVSCIKQLIPFIGNILQALQPVLSTFSDLAKNVIPIVINVVNQLMPVVSQLISSLISALAPAINQIMVALQPVIENISNLVMALIPYLKIAIEALTPVIQYVAGVISTGLTQAFETAGPIITNFTNVLNAVVSFVKDIFAGNWRGAWEDVKKIFESTFGVIGGLATVPLNAVITGINAVIGGLNSINVEIPDWVPEMGGENFGINIPLIPKLAKGGFTDGVSIAGEAGTEAVISFDPRYRNQNLENWAKAGRMLGASDGELLSLLDNAGSHSSGIIEYNVGGIEFKPQIIIQGNASKQDVVDAIREEESEFMDMLEEFFERRDDPVYG